MAPRRKDLLQLTRWIRFFGLLLVVFIGVEIIGGLASATAPFEEATELCEDGPEVGDAADEWELHHGHRWTVHRFSRFDSWGTLGQPLEPFGQELIQPPRA